MITLKFPERLFHGFVSTWRETTRQTNSQKCSSQPKTRTHPQACQGTLYPQLYVTKITNTCLFRSLFPCLNGPEKPSRYDLKIKQRKTVTKANLTLLLFMLSGVNLLDLTRCSGQSYVAIVWSLLIYRKSLSRYF